MTLNFLWKKVVIEKMSTIKIQFQKRKHMTGFVGGLFDDIMVSVNNDNNNNMT